MRKIRVAMCDENIRERDLYRVLCAQISRENEIRIGIRQYETGRALLFEMEDAQFMDDVDIVLLDVNLTDTDGITVAKKLRDYGYEGVIIFITGSPDHWRYAFDVSAFNYIIKDQQAQENFKTVFLRAVQAAEVRRTQRIVLTATGETRQIDINKIYYFEIINHIVTVHYFDKNSSPQAFSFVSTLGKLEEYLYGYGFLRVHRSFLISLFYVDKLSGNELTLANGHKIPVGRKYSSQLRAAMSDMTAPRR